MRLKILLFMTFIACALTTRANTEHVSACGPALAEIFSETHDGSSDQTPPTFEKKKDAFLSIYRAATEGLTIEELQGLTRQPFDFKNFVDATNLSRAHEKLTQLKGVLLIFSDEEQNDLMNAIQTLLFQRLSHAQSSQKSWSKKRSEVKRSKLVQILEAHKAGVNSVAFSPDGSTVASGDSDSTVRIWDPANDIWVNLESPHGLIHSVAFSPDGSTVASGDGDGTIRIWEPRNPNTKPIDLEDHVGDVFSIAFSPDGKFLASGGGSGILRLWDLKNLTAAPIRLQDHGGYVFSVAFSPDSKNLACGDSKSTIRIWNLKTLTAPPIVLEGHTGDVHSIAFSPDSKSLAACDGGGAIRIWNLSKANSDLLTPLPLESRYWVDSVAFSPDGKWLATGGYKVQIWDLSKAVPTSSRLEGHTNFVKSVAFSPNGQVLASGSIDETVRLWQWRKILGLDPTELEEDAP